MNQRLALVFASLALSVGIGLSLSRSGPASAARKRPLIGLSLDTLKEERWQHDRDLFVKAAEGLGADVLVQAANSDDTRQIQDVEALLSRKVDVLVIVPHNGAAMAKAVRLAHDAGVPVISYDRLITGAELDLYVAFDAVAIGEMQAKALVDRLGAKRARVVRINGAKTDNNSFLLKEGQDRVLGPLVKAGRLEIVHEDWAENWKPENAKKIMNAALTRLGPGLDAVLAANDGTAGGAIQALSEEGLAGKVVVIGQDAELAACQRIAAGVQSATIYKPLVLEAGAAADAAVRLARRRPVVAKAEVDNGAGKVPAVLLAVTAVDDKNMLDTVVADGYHAYDDVYRGVPESRRPKRK